MISNLVLCGASGDLTGRFLLPALATLRATGRLPEEFRVVGVAREAWDEETFRDFAARRLAEHAASVPGEHRDALVRSLRYRPADVGDADDVAAALRMAGDGPVAVYLALPPALYRAGVAAVGAARMPSGSRIAMEKPFGESLEDAVALDQALADAAGDAGEQAVFRVDHVLGMATLANLLALRRHDPLLAAVWDAEHIEQIEVRWEEDLALEGRADYYDRTGALKDVMQNHMLQILCVLAMERPAGSEEHELRDAKAAVLRAARLAGPDVRSCTQRARYGAGRIGDRAVPPYVEEEGVDPDRRTETFAEVVLELDTPRWQGTRFVLRAAKALASRRKDATVHFRATRPDGAPTSLRIGIDGPFDIALGLSGLAPMTLIAPPPCAELPPYGEVLLELLDGRSTLSVRGDEAEEAWRVVEPVLAAWREDRVPLEEYPAGSDGPPPLAPQRPPRGP